MRILRLWFLCVFLLFVNSKLHAHGFGAQTMVKLIGKSHEGWQSIKQIYDITVDYNLKAKSFNPITKNWGFQSIKVVGFSKTNCYIKISLDKSLTNVIECTPSQQFYEINLQRWVSACQLQVGCKLLRDNIDSLGDSIEILEIELIERHLPVYIIEVANTHTFLVTGLSLLTHNDVLVPTLLYTLSETAVGSSLGGIATSSALGVLGLSGGLLIGGIIAVGATYCFGDLSRTWYKLKYDIGQITKIFNLNKKTDNTKNKEEKIGDDAPDDAQAPGKPTENDGFIPKKDWDGKKVKHRRGYGWPDKNGNIWIPTGPKGHGGAHWDVQKPGGGYDNVVPGGRIRGK